MEKIREGATPPNTVYEVCSANPNRSTSFNNFAYTENVVRHYLANYFCIITGWVAVCDPIRIEN